MAERLVGRTGESAQLAGALDALAMGRGGLVVIAGEAGVGKSRLAAEVVTLATSRGSSVLVGRAVEGGATPLRPLAEAFLAAFRHTPPPRDPALQPFQAALAPLVPEWASAAAPAEPLVRNEGVLRLLSSLGGGRGCVLVIEDLHWADAETLTVIEHFAHHIAAQPVLCVCTVRTDEGSAGLAILRSAAARGQARIIDLRRLSDEDVRALAEAVGGDGMDPLELRAVCERAEGLPLLAEDLLATARTTGSPVRAVVPLTFAATVQQRMDALDAETRDVVFAAAVLGRRFDWRLLVAVARVDEAAVAAALRAATRARLVEVLPDGGLAFRHALTRDAVVAELLPIERAALARRALTAVEEAYPGLPGEWCEIAARLAVDAGDERRAALLLVEVAQRALAAGALTAAEAALERSRTLAPSGDVLLRVDEVVLQVLALAGKTDLALAVGESLLSRQSGADAAATHLLLARAAAAATRWEMARRHLHTMRPLVAADAELLVRADALEATVALTEGQPEEAVILGERALASAIAGRVPEAVCEALEVLGRAARPHDLDDAEARFSAEADAARAAGLPLWEIRALHELGTIDMLGGRGLDRLERARQLAADAGALAIAAVVSLQLASSYALTFQPELALQRGQEGVAVAELLGLGLTLAMLHVQMASAHAVAGRRAEMEAAIQKADALAPGHAEVWVVAWGHCRGLLELLEERRDAALAAFREAVRWSRRPECGIPGAFAGWLALVATLDAEDGGAAVRADVRETAGSRLPLNQAVLGYAEAVSLGRQGCPDEAAARVAAMDDLLSAMDGREGWRHLAHRFVAEGAIRDGWGEPAAWLREALPWFDAHRYGAVAAACRQLLTEAGAPVPRRGRGGTAVPPPLVARGVTTREADVLALVGEGLSNPEIATRLYLSPRTVEKHVERLREKTSAASRTELAKLAAKFGMVGR